MITSIFFYKALEILEIKVLKFAFGEKSKAKVRISHKFAFRGNSHFAKIRISHKFAFRENSHFAKIRISHKFAFCENSHFAKIRISHKFAFPKNSHAKSRIWRQFRIMRIFRMRIFCSHFAKIMRI